MNVWPLETILVLTMVYVRTQTVVSTVTALVLGLKETDALLVNYYTSRLVYICNAGIKYT